MKTIKQKLREIPDTRIKEENGKAFVVENLGTKTFNFNAMKDSSDVKSFSIEKATVNGKGNLEATLREPK